MITRHGWNAALQDAFAPFAAEGLVPGRVTVQLRGLYRVITDAGEMNATVSGRLGFTATGGDYPVTGDWVALDSRPGERAATIQRLMPRSSRIIRQAAGSGHVIQVVAANVDVSFLVMSLNADLNLRRLERYLALTHEGGSRPVVVLTKADASADIDARIAEVRGVAGGTEIVAISSKTGQGLDRIRALIPEGQTAVVLGSSGVGKSTLVNALAGATVMATKAIRESDARGRHTTSHRELFLLPHGGLILDTPGMREVSLLDSESGIAASFDDIEALAADCRFGNCSHTTEPGCAVQVAIAGGTLAPDRLEGYRKLMAEQAAVARRADPKRVAEQKQKARKDNRAARKSARILDDQD